MITIRPSAARGHIDHGWLDTRHTFSFGHYYDASFMGFRALRVINEDVIAAGAGFGKHFHDDMEILTYVLEGAVAHQDNTGGSGTIAPGEVQRMTAGSGIIHSEFNASKTERLHLLQVWIMTEKARLAPGYEQRSFVEAMRGSLALIASRGGRNGSLHINQDVDVRAGRLLKGFREEIVLAPGRGAWVQVARGSLRVNNILLSVGDGAAVEDEAIVVIEALEDSEVLVFDLA